MKNNDTETKFYIYQTKSGAIQLRTDITKETFWLAQLQAASIFNVKKAAISKHVKKYF